jgi:hypothetical protein
LLSGQQGWPGPPQALHALFTQPVSCPLQNVLPPLVQHGWPMPPQVPQEPPLHCAPAKQLAPAATQAKAPAVLTQQPPLSHARPLQHGSPGAPQATQLPPKTAPLQTVPGAVQYCAPPVKLLQQAWPTAPQGVKPPAPQEPMPQVNMKNMEQEPPAMTQVPSWMQQPPPAHVRWSQQGCVSPPQAVQAPAEQTVAPAAQSMPSCRHVLPTQQPPALHAAPAVAQHGSS